MPKRKVRTSLHDEESIYDDNKSCPMFLGSCIGVRLLPRDSGDSPHILIEFLVEDDCSWNPMGSGGMSTHWIQDLEEVLDAAKKYLKKYAKIEDDGLGYRAKGRLHGP